MLTALIPNFQLAISKACHQLLCWKVMLQIEITKFSKIFVHLNNEIIHVTYYNLIMKTLILVHKEKAWIKSQTCIFGASFLVSHAITAY